MLETPKTPEGTRIYAIGDIHGRADLLRELHAKIATDLAERPVAHGVLIHLGDYIDRGPSSKKVIDHLIEKPLAGLETINLKGNHEDSLLSFYKNSECGDNWFVNGGGETLKSYGIEISDDPFQEFLYLEEIHANFLNRLPESHLAFLNNLTLHHREGDYLFVHAGLRPGVALESQSDEDLLWIRSDFLFSDADFGFMVVHGHSPRPTPVVRSNRIGIDTMAYRSGCLTCLVLEGTERHFISTELKMDCNAELAAVRENGWALQYAAEDLRADREIVLDAFDFNLLERVIVRARKSLSFLINGWKIKVFKVRGKNLL